MITILLVLAAIIAVVLIAALFMKKDHYVRREILINAPRQKVFDFLRLLRNQEKFNKWAMADPDRDREFKGTDGTVGFIIAWNGDKSVGEGQKEIMAIIEGKRIETQVRFVRPMATTANVNFETEAPANQQTKVYMTNAGSLKYPLNVMIPIAEKNFAKDMDISLTNLKAILEQ